jgi:3-deoxy-D-manno-octulosonic acid kinase
MGPHGARRGGLVGKIVVDRYLSGSRPFRELDILVLARSHNVPVPEAVAASSIRAGLFCHRGRIVTRLIPDARTLPVFVGEERDDARRVAKVLETAGTAIRKMHDAGIDHADLNMNNILVDKKGAVFIIDFDKATAHREFGQHGRLRNLRRLLRSARKLSGMGLSFSDTDFETILTGYSSTDKQLLEKLKDSTTGSRRAALRGFLSRLIQRAN